MARDTLTVNVRVPQRLIERMDAIVDIEYTSRSSIMIRALAQYLDALDATETIKKLNASLEIAAKQEVLDKLSPEERQQYDFVKAFAKYAEEGEKEYKEKIK